MLTMAIPKGRILEELMPVLTGMGIHPTADFYDENSRALRFNTQNPQLQLIRVRAFDVVTYVASGAAAWGVVGSDVLAEFGQEHLYSPVDLDIGHCRLVLAGQMPSQDWRQSGGEVRVATKYPQLTQSWFAAHGMQADIIKLSGALELAPQIGMAPYIVDLVSSGATLKANGLHELAVLMPVSTRLIINRQAYKTDYDQITRWLSHLSS